MLSLYKYAEAKAKWFLDDINNNFWPCQWED